MATIAERIREALELRGMKQAELVEKTGIGKSSISTYISGEYEPKQRNIYKIAKALNVNEAWLLGRDVSMERNENILKELAYFNDQIAINNKMQYELSSYLDEIENGEISDERKEELLIKINKLLGYGERAKLRDMLLRQFYKLNETGMNEAIKRVEELTFIDKYIKESKITPLPKKEEMPEHLLLNAARPLKGATEEDRKHDDDIMDDPDF